MSALSEESIGGGTPKTSIKEYWDGKIPWIQSSDLQEHDVKNIRVNKRITEAAIKNSAAKLIPKNSLAIVTRVGVGKVSLIPFEYSTSQDFLSLSNLLVDKWFGTYLLYYKLQNELLALQGTSIKGITKKEVLDKYIYTPVNFKEQKLVGNIMSEIEKNINLHQQKIQVLGRIKSQYLYKIFPKQEQDEPDLRFNSFEEAWEQRKLKEILLERNEKIVETNKYPLMSFVQGRGVTPKSKRYNRDFLVKDDQKKYKKTILDDFIYSSNNLETGSIGLNKTGNAVISPVYSIFYSENNIGSKFIGYLSLRRKFINKMLRYRQGVVYGQWRIHEKDFLNIATSLPSEKEQHSIIKFLEYIDNLIVLHQRKLSLLEKLKQSFLQKMFL